MGDYSALQQSYLTPFVKISIDNLFQSDSDRELADTIDPEIAAEVIHNTLDQHYRQCLDEPIPMLGDKTPRQCAKSKRGREQVIEWLKYLENNELRRATDQGQETYDSRWMWEALDLAEYRNG